ncbi:family S53 protease-like protein [Mycena epipterygia]|nr:family S53 protease-like protein [Mycena epipterygia]
MVSFKHLPGFLAIVASVTANTLVLHERRTTPPSGFVTLGPVSTLTSLTLRFALAANNVTGLQDKLTSVSTPGSPNFRKWLSKDEVKSFIQPSSETTAAFNAFAAANGLKPTVISPAGDWVSITLPVFQANKLFGAQYEQFFHPSLRYSTTRTLSMSLPPELVGHVDAIHPSTSFPSSYSRLLSPDIQRATKRGEPPASCDSTNPDGRVTPTCLQELYNIPTTPATEKNNVLGITGYGGEFPLADDLATFLQLFRPDIPSNISYTLTSIDNASQSESGEANLDVQYTAGVATGVPLQFFGAGNSSSDFGTEIFDTTTFLLSVDNPPTVLTTSYALTEDDFGISLATKVCNGYMALGARGVSVLFASGDGGVQGNHDGLSRCTNNFRPVFPASCPFVTTVGATQGISPEKAINFTSGGFSSFFLRPAYQDNAVASFLKTIPADFPGVFNSSGRGFPDLAVQGWNTPSVLSGETFASGGTSVSTPIVASMISLINDRLISSGKPVLGFLNPWLYANPSAFTDITIGHNSGFHCPESSAAFNATEGWDALSGMGSPLFDKLLAAAGA